MQYIVAGGQRKYKYRYILYIHSCVPQSRKVYMRTASSLHHWHQSIQQGRGREDEGPSLIQRLFDKGWWIYGRPTFMRYWSAQLVRRFRDRLRGVLHDIKAHGTHRNLCKLPGLARGPTLYIRPEHDVISDPSRIYELMPCLMAYSLPRHLGWKNRFGEGLCECWGVTCSVDGNVGGLLTLWVMAERIMLLFIVLLLFFLLIRLSSLKIVDTSLVSFVFYCFLIARDKEKKIQKYSLILCVLSVTVCNDNTFLGEILKT